jgi:hypothetical protein
MTGFALGKNLIDLRLFKLFVNVLELASSMLFGMSRLASSSLPIQAETG